MAGVDLNKISTTISVMILLLSFLLCTQAVAHLCVVVADVNPTRTDLSANDVERIFLGKMKRWPDGRLITIVYNDEKEARESFSHHYLHRSWSQVSTFWRKKLYSGGSMLPIFVQGHEQVKEYLVSHPGAISYLDCEELDPRVQVIEVD